MNAFVIPKTSAMAGALKPVSPFNRMGKHHTGIVIAGKAAGEAQREKTRRIVRGVLNGR